MAEELTVYLDHLIPRESLRFRRPQSQVIPLEQKNLRLDDLQNPSRSKYLRKPDFQRETWAWTPEDCVSLLESVTNEQVIPSIIMWSSQENGYDYILDGGHRVSVILAWMRDDWGDKLPSEAYRDDQHERNVKDAAREVRRLVNLRVGTIQDYERAEKLIEHLTLEGQSPQKELSPQIFRRGFFFQRLLKGYAELHVLWVHGDYEKAEQSFLKINKSGRQLSEWEIRLIDNRNSAFARVLMSVASITSAKYYWPVEDAEIRASPDQVEKVQYIIEGIQEIYSGVFQPIQQEPIRTLQQPLLVVSGSQQRPYYLAELLTVIQGGKGQLAETERLLAQGRDASPNELVAAGYKIVGDTLDALNHLIGPSTNPKSLSIVPAVYFYTNTGRYVRSMLYGFLYWLLNGGNAEVILDRKRVFSAHRAAFETILLERKNEIVSGLTRRTGSGPDITAQTANYFDGLLRLLMQHEDNIEGKAFQDEYQSFVKGIIKRIPREVATEDGRSRVFTDRQRSTVVLQELLRSPARCGICGGILDVTTSVQFDHVQPVVQGGPTVVSNARLSHPFCNNPKNREVIEQMRNGSQTVALPEFFDTLQVTNSPQLPFAFIDDPEFNPRLPL